MDNYNQPGMIRIAKAGEEHAQLVSELGKKTFWESHGDSGSREDIQYYTETQYGIESIRKKLTDSTNNFHIIFYKDEPAGFSNIIFDAALSAITQKNVTELDKLYLLKSFHGLQLGLALINYNIEVSKNNDQSGMWLYVWKQNTTAITFYKKMGFEITGNHDFIISATRSNPNHLMLLKY